MRHGASADTTDGDSSCKSYAVDAGHGANRCRSDAWRGFMRSMAPIAAGLRRLVAGHRPRHDR